MLQNSILKQGLLAMFTVFQFSNCVMVANAPGPHGRDGVAFFGIDYESVSPYSYWDSNPSIPYDMMLGAYYRSSPGVYDFEYFINSHEYWYGTYEIWINHGEPGGPYGEAGRDGADNYFMLICNPWGFHSHINGTSIGKKWEDEEIVIERDDNSQGFRITVRKTTVDDRTPRSPKLITE